MQPENQAIDPHPAAGRRGGGDRLEVRLTEILSDSTTPFDGGLYVSALPEEVPFVVDVPDFGVVKRRLTCPSDVTIQLAAFAHDLKTFADKTAFSESQAAAGARMAPDFFVPVGLFTPDLKAIDPPKATAWFAGRVKGSELRTNHSTGNRFLVVQVETLMGRVDVVADPSMVEGCLVGIAQVHGWLSARVITPLRPTGLRRYLPWLRH